jgi:hypothetical protein
MNYGARLGLATNPKKLRISGLYGSRVSVDLYLITKTAMNGN